MQLPILAGSRQTENQALIINLFGGPCVGKSTLASRIFAKLKASGVEAACPEEQAKLAIWRGQSWILDEQVILAGRSWETLCALSDKVDAIVVDSPILLGTVYGEGKEPPCFHDLVIDLHKRSKRINLLLERARDDAYSTHGRRESQEEALEKDVLIRRKLDLAGEDYLLVPRDKKVISDIVTRLIRAAKK